MRFLPSAVMALWCLLPAATRAELPQHNIVAANIDVVQLDNLNNSSSVLVTNSYSIGDFRIRDGSNRGDFNIQIGDDPSDDWTSGILMSSVRQNGRDNGETGATLGTIYSVSMIQPGASGYLIDINIAGTNGSGANPEYNVNVAGAWFPYTNWLGGYAYPASLANGSATVTNDTLMGSPQLTYGVNYIDKGAGGGANAGKSVVDLTSLGIDSRTDGILIVNGAKNESANYGLSQCNSNNGTWNLFVRDTGNTGNGEQDPIAFVFIPKTNTTVVSGRFNGNGNIAMFSGSSPQFTVTQLGTGRYELKIPGRSPAGGVLIISAEGGGSINFDNIVSYQVNAAGDGWEIQSRDCPAVYTAAGGIAPPLESPGPNEAVCSFVYIPGPTPGFTVTPTNGLLTTESGGQATFTVALDYPPADDVTIPLSSSNTGEGTVSPSSLTFHPDDWNIPQTVTVTGVDDAIVDGSIAYKIVLAAASSTDTNYNGLKPDDVSVVNADNEGGITVAPTTGLVTTEAGGTATFNVHLNTQPSASVTIPVSSSNTGEGTVSPSSLTFDPGNWNVDQTVTITGVDDLVADGNMPYTIVLAPAQSTDTSYNGLTSSAVSVVNMDNDVAGLLFDLNVLNGLSVVEGSTVNFTVALTSQPTNDVIVNFASGNTAQGGTVSPATRTFTSANWNVPQSIAITASDDLVLDGNTLWVVTNSCTSADRAYAGLAPVTFPVVTLDNEAILNLPSGDLVYGIGQPGLGIDGRATLIDSNTPSYSGAHLTVVLAANGSVDDRLEIRNTGIDVQQIGVSGNSVTYEGVGIGTFSGGAGTAPLSIDLNGASTPTSAQALLRNVVFRNVNTNNPSLARRTVVVTLSRADGDVVSATNGVQVGLLRVVDFQEGADHGYGAYTGENDLELLQSSPNTPFPRGSANNLTLDWPDAGGNNQSEVLLRFDNILGDAFAQVPTNAVIVAADLVLYVDPTVSNSQGDGSPLYRLLMPFDPTNDTWSSWGNGVDADDYEAMSAYDSQLGVAGASGDSGTGYVHVGVLADIQAWAAGQANYGWAMPAWPSGTDALIFRSSGAANIDQRPRLRISWVPATSAMASFRQGVNNYTDAHDTRIRASAPDVEASTATSVFVDWDVNGSGTQNEDQVLVRFDNIIGTGPGQVPPGSQIHAAMLDLATTANNGYGDGGQFFAMFKPWVDTDTWNTLDNGISTDGVEAAATPSASAGSAALNPNVCGGFMSFDVTPDVQAWANNTRPNYGWAILPWRNGGDGWAVSMSESLDERERPRLRVFYTPGLMILSLTRNGANATLQFVGPAGVSCSVQRATSLNGPFTTLGTVSTQADGTAAFTDNAAPGNAAFYRVSIP